MMLLAKGRTEAAWASAVGRFLAASPEPTFGAAPPNIYQLTLLSMIPSGWIVYASWIVAGLAIGLLGHPLIALASTLAGMIADTFIQSDLRRRLALAGTIDENDGLRGLELGVSARFALGVAGPLAAAIVDPILPVIAVLLVMQVWSVCVAAVQFTTSYRLYLRAIAAPVAAIVLALVPSLGAAGGAALFVAIALMVAILIGVVGFLGVQKRAIWARWAKLCQDNTVLIEEITLARDAAVHDRNLAAEALEAAKAADIAKSAFLTTMSHEIRTPLNGVLGMAQVMEGGDLEDIQRGRLDVIRQSGDALLRILNDILDMAKIESGRFELESMAFDADALMAGVHAAFLAVAQQKGLRLDLCSDGEALGWRQGDPARIRQVLFNLTSNALKFTAAGEVVLSARRQGERLVFAVRDTGPGIGEDQMGRLFEKFVQLDSSVTREHGGSGLGLSISRDLAQMMGGEITVVSTVGQGATFTFSLLAKIASSLPAKIASPPSSGAATDDAQGGGRPETLERRVRVLVAEDNAVNQLVITTVLGQIGVDAFVVGDGKAAVDAWKDGAWDVILMDIQMPVMGGVDATGAIRDAERLGGLTRTPILALTANAMTHQRDAYLAAGIDAVVAKPFNVAELVAALEKALAKADDVTRLSLPEKVARSAG